MLVSGKRAVSHIVASPETLCLMKYKKKFFKLYGIQF